MFNIGIDLGGTNIAGAIVNAEGKMIVTKSVPTLREREWQEKAHRARALNPVILPSPLCSAAPRA